MDVEIDGKLHTINLTPPDGQFTPFFLVECTNLIEIDITDCFEINPQDFIECVVFAKKLQKVVMDKCSQFSMSQLVKMFQHLVQIRIISLVACQGLDFSAAYCIISSSHSVEKMDFEPRNVGNIPDWWRFKSIFFTVDFGPSFLSKFSGTL